MNWDLQEALAYYQKQGAPKDQTELVNLLREIQQENGGAIPAWTLSAVEESWGVKVSFLQAVIRRIPSLRMENTHLLELCGGVNCGRRKALAEFAEKTYGKNPTGITIRYTGCMRMCGKGPNLKWDGKIYHQADEALLRRLIEHKGE